MALKFEGDINGISERQFEFISNLIKEQGFGNPTLMIEAMGKPGDNYMASMKKIIVEEDGKVLKIVAKIALTNEHMREWSKTDIRYSNEHIMYTEILPKFAELEESAGVPENERLKFATCYGSLLEAPNDIVLLEDLNESNFVMMDRFGSLTDESIRLVLQSLAKLHSLSLVLKQKEPDIYISLTNKLINAMIPTFEAKELKIMVHKMEDNLLMAIPDEKTKGLLKGSLKNLENLYMKNLKIDSESRYSVIQHGDPWTNNFMIRLLDDKPVECRMIDYQQSGVNSPVADIQVVIFNLSDYETRSKHYHEWIDFYHNEVDKHLNHFGLKASLIYSREQFDAELKRHGKLSFAIALLFAGMMMAGSSEAAQLKETTQNAEPGKELNMEEVMKSLLSSQAMGRYMEKVQGLIRSVIELGYLEFSE